MSVIQLLHRCDAVSLSHLWPTYFKSVLRLTLQNRSYKYSSKGVPIHVKIPARLFHHSWNPTDRASSPTYGNSIFHVRSRRIYPWLIARSGLPTPRDLTSSAQRYRANDAVSTPSVATDRFVSINRNLLICLLFSTGLSLSLSPSLPTPRIPIIIL